MKEEIWKDAIYKFIDGRIVDYTGYYKVSNLGNVRSIERNYVAGKGCVLKTKGKLINIQNGVDNYKLVPLCKDGYEVSAHLHRLVASTFPEICGEWFKGAEINHKDENPANNSAYNLEWCSSNYNANYGGRNKRIGNNNKGNHNTQLAKAVLQYDLQDNYIKEWLSTREIERELGFDHKAISACCRGKQKTGYGYIWKYKEAVS